MNMLNNNINIQSIPEDHRKAFRNKNANPVTLKSNHLLFKFTGNQLFRSDGSVTEWWFSVDPLGNAPGFTKTYERGGSNLKEFIRARAAVSKHWGNSLRDLKVIKLKCPVKGLLGQCSGQPFDENEPGYKNVTFIGGEWQVYIPNLTRIEVEEIQ